MIDLSIIIVSYNTKDLLRQTIQSVISTAHGFSYEIIVVDNASKDGSPEMVRECFKEVNLIANDGNYGFSKANNIGIKVSTGKYVLLLNSDTVVLDNTLLKCIGYMDQNSGIGALGCRVELRDGSLDHACKRGFPTPWASLCYMLKLHKLFPKWEKFGRYDMTYLPEDRTNEVDCLIGAFMMVRRVAIDRVGLLDEEFFMYGEDIDWCYRIKEGGYKVVYYPEVKIIHYKGQSSKKRRFMTIYEFHHSMYLFYRKHYFKKYNILVTALVYAGIFIKMGLVLFVNLFKKRT